MGGNLFEVEVHELLFGPLRLLPVLLPQALQLRLQPLLVLGFHLEVSVREVESRPSPLLFKLLLKHLWENTTKKEEHSPLENKQDFWVRK